MAKFIHARKAMKDRGVTYKKLSELTGFSVSRLCGAVNGRPASDKVRRSMALAWVWIMTPFGPKKRSGTRSGLIMADCSTPKDLQITTDGERTLACPAPDQNAAIDPFKMSKNEIEACTARSNVVAEYRKVRTLAEPGEVLRAKKRFIRDFNLGEFGPYPDLFKQTGKLTFQTLERWLSKYKATKDPLALADNRGKHRKGQSCVTPEQARISTAIALSPMG